MHIYKNLAPYATSTTPLFVLYVNTIPPRMMTIVFFAHNSSNYYCLDTFGASSVLRCLKKGMECNMKLVDGFLCYLKEASLFQST